MNRLSPAVRWALFAALVWLDAASAQTARVATPAELAALYPDFNPVHFRIAGHRIGWTQVKAWPAHPGWEVAIVERLQGEGEQAPRDFEIAVLEPGPPPKVIARWVGFPEHHSPGESTAAARIVSFDLGAFEIAEGEMAFGIQTETPSRSRLLTLFRVEAPRLKPILSVDKRAGGLKLLKRKGASFRDVVIPGEAKGDPETTYRWQDGVGYQRLSPVAPPPSTE